MNKKLNEVMNSLAELIINLESCRDSNDRFSDEEKELLSVSNASYELLARTKMVSSIMSKNPDEEESDLYPEVQTFAPTSSKKMDDIFENIKSENI